MLTDLAYWVRTFLAFDVGTIKGAPLEPLLEKLSTQSVIADPHDEIKNAVTNLLAECNLPFPVTPYNHEFHNACCQVARSKGYAMETYPGARSLHPFMPGGVVMATTAYAHLDNKSTQIFIALYTAFLIYLDDVFQHDIELVYCFNERFILCQPQDDPVLDGFASLLREFPQHFGRVVSNIMTTSTLNLVTALLLEHETQNMKSSLDAHNYPTFSRVMSGASETYALFAFPPQIPMPFYIQALPEDMMFINNVNDVLSFYKEDSAGETVNRVSNLARCHGVSKMEVIHRLSQDAATCHSQVLRILSPHRDAHTAYANFSQGYIGFHASLARYRLNELFS
ncbi:uncharacterized protein LACBIDRAFT_331339 [Laccaria bicolor S238N-H82]|uniref:Predicted protein n=1 Tax=Laccaria bicolor (strain S238N-H82 / ATCC MYA-4686) TaxID=486041 RepID=B0DP69_LACBS|nr:uncharacterized protein LACBIDRAFT_331339 [Laccaria bicolor S238N-H82]EDR03562.1 predicted protein [Laccaria bicolor S238N-H82]|eukprot:XP_001885710.1 predicted protein [Laccaria bicolor S238N-H82]